MIDTALIKIQAGDGGNGRVSFRREKYVPKGGPDGGDGGDGGSVYFTGDRNMSTLMDFRSKPFYKAQDGEEGGKKQMHGANGKDLYIKVPVGTLIYEKRLDDEVLVSDLNKHEKAFLAARGGTGGKGNYRFKSSVNRTPVQYTEGVKGEEKEVKLEIKLIADVGLIGAPNAGKSTLLNKLTKSNAKVASYPFTTLSPNLGTYTLKSGKSIIIADIPGLIEGASEGKGLGDEFLRHIERTRLLVFIIDPLSPAFISEGDASSFYKDDNSMSEKDIKYDEKSLSENTVKTYEIITNELINYGRNLDKKETIIVINKTDITEIKENMGNIIVQLKHKLGQDTQVFGISAATGEGIEDLMNHVMKLLSKIPEGVEFKTEKPVKLYTIENLPNKRIVYKENVKEKPLKRRSLKRNV